MSVAIHLGFLLSGFSVFYCGKPEFLQYKTVWHRIAYYNLAMTGQRFMYYIPWLVNDAGSIASGLAYNGTAEIKT